MRCNWRRTRGETSSPNGAYGSAYCTSSSLTWSMPHSGAPPDTHRDPQTSAPVLPNRDYTMGHVGTPLPASGYNWLPTRPDREDTRPADDLGWALCRRGVPVGS